MKLVMEEGWWWRWRRIPLSGAPNGLHIYPPKEEQGLAAALYRKTRWILLSNFFLPEREYMKSRLSSMERQGAHKAGGRAQGGRVHPHPRGQVEAPLTWILLPVFLLFSKNKFRGVSGHSENFLLCRKITPWQFCWKQRQSGLVPFKSCKLESKKRAKVFGKVDTMETYQLPQA